MSAATIILFILSATTLAVSLFANRLLRTQQEQIDFWFNQAKMWRQRCQEQEGKEDKDDADWWKK